MLLLDVNVVLAIQRADHPHHLSIRRWFERLLTSYEPFSVPTVVWTSFLRVTTNRRIFEVPTPFDDAFEFMDSVCAQPGHLLLTPGLRHLELVRRLCLEADAVGDLVPDAVIAAVALEHSCTVATLDRDFARFSSVQHLRPGQNGLSV
jgi:uncharacterized protein